MRFQSGSGAVVETVVRVVMCIIFHNRGSYGFGAVPVRFQSGFGAVDFS